MKPGSAEFRRALQLRMEAEPALAALGPPAIDGEEWVSRNTVIYRCHAGPARFVAKAQATKPRGVVAAEYDVLRDLDRKLGGPRVRSLHAVALFEELGVLVTREESGESVRTLVERGLGGSEDALARASAAVEAAADALWTFHESGSGASRSLAASDDRVRCYLDFSPRNLLIHWAAGGREVSQVVLMDVPEKELWAGRTHDIGVFCYDLARIRFLPVFVWKPGVSLQIDRLKACFIHSYYAHAPARWEARRTLQEIEAAERRRAAQALRWYVRPWRYQRVIRELARLFYLGPLTAFYYGIGVRRSFVRLHRMVESSDAESTPASRAY